MTPSQESYSIGRRLVEISRLLDGARGDLGRLEARSPTMAAASSAAVDLIYEAESKLYAAARALGWRP